jgi:putative transcriptional regulator
VSRKALRNRVREARLRKKLSQRELGRLSGLSRQTINAIEISDDYRPSGDVMVRLAEVLEMDLGSLFWTEAAVEKVPA